MLILSRRIDDTIVIDENITVRVIAIENGQVKLGIEAPRSVPVVRGELIAAVAAENSEAKHSGHASQADPNQAIDQAMAALNLLQANNEQNKK